MATLELTPRQALDQLQRDLGATPSDIAAALGASERTLERWRDGATHPQHEARRRLGELITLDARLHEAFDDAESVRSWMRADNRVLGGFSPLDALRVGRMERVHAALDALDAGIFV